MIDHRRVIINILRDIKPLLIKATAINVDDVWYSAFHKG